MSLDGSMQRRLAVYGTLAPGRSNHGQLSELRGEWFAGTVRGRLIPEGWGAALGFPGLILDPNGAEVAVQVFESDELAQHWERLDEFEGDGYRREITQIETTKGSVDACIYVLAEPESKKMG